MERMNEAKVHVFKLYKEYIEVLNITPPPLNFDDIKTIEKAFQSIYFADAKATRNRTTYPRTLSADLRKAFADLLLLMEGKDLIKDKEEASLLLKNGSTP